MAEAKKYPYDDQFPQNVNPTEENRREFSERMERELTEAQKADILSRISAPEGAALEWGREEARKLDANNAKEDASNPNVVAATRTVPVDEPEPEPEASERPAKKRQGQAVN